VGPDVAFLGLIARAHAYSYGDRLMQDIRKSKVTLVLLSSSASARSAKQILDKCKTHQVEVIENVEQSLIEHYFNRPVIAIGITDRHMAEKVVKEMRYR
jgi:ribosomal protein L7Ae-like RNA K-turn-binding protein